MATLSATKALSSIQRIMKKAGFAATVTSASKTTRGKTKRARKPKATPA
jgi:hypothetical protein